MPSPSKKRAGSKPKIKHVVMITDAIFTLADRKGSTREAIWKYISSQRKYKESIFNKKTFLAQLRRLSKGNDYFSKTEGNN